MGAVLKAQVEAPIFGFPQAQAQTPAEAPVLARRKIKALKAARGGAKQAAASATTQADVDVRVPVVMCTEAAHKQYEAVFKAAQDADQAAFKAKQQAFLAQEEAKAPVPRRRIRVLKAAKAEPQQSAVAAKQADADVLPTAVSCAEAAHKQYEAELKAAKQAAFIKARQQALFEQEAAKQEAAEKLVARPKVRVMRAAKKPQAVA